MLIFLSAVSDEFHKPDPAGMSRFESYRDVLARELRGLGPAFNVVTQEELAQGVGDLLHTLEREILQCDVVVHLVGHMSGHCPEPGPVLRLRKRSPQLLDDYSELRDAFESGDVSYTQWELYLAFGHNRKRLVYLAEAEARRSPACQAAEMDTSQLAHLARVKSTGEHRESFENQLHLAFKVVKALVRSGIMAEAAKENAHAVESTRAEAADLTRQIAEFIRKPPKELAGQLDPTGVALFLQAVDTAALERELTRRQTLEIVAEYKETLSEKLEKEPTEADLYELALAELAEGQYPEAIQAARRCAELAEHNLASHPDAAAPYRESALNAYLLVRDACKAAGRRDDALAALKAGCVLIDRERDPILWAEYHEELATAHLDRAEPGLAEELISEIIDIREELEPESVALANSLLLWCRQLDEQGRYSDIIGVAARAEQIFSSHTPPLLRSIASALLWRAEALKALCQLAEAEGLFRRALDIEGQLGHDQPEVAMCLTGLVTLLYDAGRLAEAEPLCRRALAITEKSYGPDDERVTAPLGNLARLLSATNRQAEAEPLFRRTLAISEQSYEPNHPNVSTALCDLARWLEDTNRRAEAEPLFRRALAKSEQNGGPDHPSVAIALSNLAMLLQHANRPAEAEPLLRRALAISEQSFGPNHPKVANRLDNLAYVLAMLRRFAESEPLWRRALVIWMRFQRDTGYVHPSFQTVLGMYRKLFRAIGLADSEIDARIDELEREASGE